MRNKFANPGKMRYLGLSELTLSSHFFEDCLAGRQPHSFNLTKLKTQNMKSLIFLSSLWLSCLFTLFTFAGFSQIGPANVLILWDVNGSHVQTIKTFLEDEGMNVYVPVLSSTQFDGTNPSLSGIDVIVHCVISVTSDMPLAGQLAVVNFVQNERGGYVHSEWITRSARISNKYQNMLDLILFDQSSSMANFGTVTYNMVAGQSSHEVMLGLPNSFSFTHLELNLGSLHTFLSDPATTLMTDNYGSDAVAVRRIGDGRIVGFNHGSFADLTDTNVEQLWINAVTWADVPPPPCYTNTWTGAVNKNWHQAGNWSCLQVPDDTMDVVIADAVREPILNNLASPVIKGLRVDSAAVLRINTPAVLNITGDLDCIGDVEGGGTLRFAGSSVQDLVSPATLNTFLSVASGATLRTNDNLTMPWYNSLMHGVGTPGGGGTVLGNVKCQKNGSHLWYAFNIFSSPVSGTPVNILGTQVWDFDEANNDPISFRNDWQIASGNMQNSRGYTSRGAGSIVFDGAPNEGNFTQQVSHTISSNPAEDGWNCVGNPYPSSIQITQFLNDNAGVIDGAVYLWDDPLTWAPSFTHGDYAVRNLSGAIAGGANNVPGNFIASGQGFFVHKTNPGTGVVNFTNSMRRITNSQFFRESDEVQRVKLSLSHENGAYNETLVAFNEDATDFMDNLYDARKLKGNSSFSFYSELDGQPLAIQTLNPVEQETKNIPLTIESDEGGTFTIEVTEFENFPENINVTLEDKHAVLYIELWAGETYTFTTESEAAVIQNRFFLNVEREKVQQPTLIQQPNQLEVNLVFLNGKLELLANQSISGELKIHNVLGQQLSKVEIDNLEQVKVNVDSPEGNLILVTLFGDNMHRFWKLCPMK